MTTNRNNTNQNKKNKSQVAPVKDLKSIEALSIKAMRDVQGGNNPVPLCGFFPPKSKRIHDWSVANNNFSDSPSREPLLSCRYLRKGSQRDANIRGTHGSFTDRLDNCHIRIHSAKDLKRRLKMKTYNTKKSKKQQRLRTIKDLRVIESLSIEEMCEVRGGTSRRHKFLAWLKSKADVYPHYCIG